VVGKIRWSLLALARQFARQLMLIVNEEVVHLAIDGTLTLRASKKVSAADMLDTQCQ
jgi:hypothetical protein